jgi:hypothetical protein
MRQLPAVRGDDRRYLQAWIEDLRQSRDRWRDLALHVERAGADVAIADLRTFASADSSRAA